MGVWFRDYTAIGISPTSSCTCVMAERVELIPFLQPDGEEKTLYVTGIPTSLPYEDKWHVLWEAFSDFGLLYDVHLPMQTTHIEAPGATVAAPPGSGATEYAFVKFYSSRAASTAQKHAERWGIRMSGWILRVSCVQVARQYLSCDCLPVGSFSDL